MTLKFFKRSTIGALSQGDERCELNGFSFTQLCFQLPELSIHIGKIVLDRFYDFIGAFLGADLLQVHVGKAANHLLRVRRAILGSYKVERCLVDES